jgi:hypothetical protein
MATRAERFKSTTARHAETDSRTSPAKGKGGKGKNGKSGGQRTPSTAKRLAQAAPADERRYGGPSTAARNRSLGKKAIYALEDTQAPAKPSRKSTRRGKNRVKAATPLTSRQKLKVTSPTQQHDRGR